MITVRHLSKIYQNNGTPLTVLSDVNCEIKKGEVISIIGPSGTGKSTFLRCLNRLETPSGGEIIIDGVNILDKKADLAKVRCKMGMVFQNFNLFNHLSIIENIMVGPVKLLGMSKEEARAQGMDLLKSVGLQDKAENYPADLSGGQKQRVAIARALSMKPEILLFDEPTSALDPTMVGEVLSVIRRLAEKGMTMLIVTHEMSFAREVSSRIFFMCKGIIYEDASPEQIFDNPQNPLTKVFINKIRRVEFRVEDGSYDLYGMSTEIRSYFLRYTLNSSAFEKIERILREMLENILPLSQGPLDISVTFTEKTSVYKMKFVQHGCSTPLLEDKTQPSVAAVHSFCSMVREEPCPEGWAIKLHLE